jgi:phosphonate transport system substrate-binding protein
MQNFWVGWIIIIGILLGCLGCDQTEQTYTPSFSDVAPIKTEELIFGVHPLHNPQRLFEVYEPLIAHLNNHLHKDQRFVHIKIKLEASTSYAAYEKKLALRHFAFTLPNPYQTLKALEQGYRIFGKMGDDDKFRGLILVRKDQHIENISQLKGKTISYPACSALAGTFMPQYYLYQQGLKVHSDLNNIYVGSQESSIMSVFLGKAEAGTTWTVPWDRFKERKPEIAEQLEVKWQTHSLPNNSLMVRNDISAELLGVVAAFFFNLQTYPEGIALLRRIPISHFEAANTTSYQAVADFMQQFMQTVGIDYKCSVP